MLLFISIIFIFFQIKKVKLKHFCESLKISWALGTIYLADERALRFRVSLEVRLSERER